MKEEASFSDDEKEEGAITSNDDVCNAAAAEVEASETEVVAAAAVENEPGGKVQDADANAEGTPTTALEQQLQQKLQQL